MIHSFDPTISRYLNCLFWWDHDKHVVVLSSCCSLGDLGMMDWTLVLWWRCITEISFARRDDWHCNLMPLGEISNQRPNQPAVLDTAGKKSLSPCPTFECTCIFSSFFTRKACFRKGSFYFLGRDLFCRVCRITRRHLKPLIESSNKGLMRWRSPSCIRRISNCSTNVRVSHPRSATHSKVPSWCFIFSQNNTNNES